MVSRIAFAFEDLEREIRSLCDAPPLIALELEPDAYQRVSTAIADHRGTPLVGVEKDGIMRVGGIDVICKEP